jgi:anti-sigma-K factor RskA
MACLPIEWFDACTDMALTPVAADKDLHVWVGMDDMPMWSTSVIIPNRSARLRVSYATNPMPNSNGAGDLGDRR